MGTPASNGDAAATLDELKPPAGVVLPPREIRNVLEKTAGYVARNGPVFEDRIRDKEQQNPKFSFLNPSDAYNAFYLWRLEEIRAGRGTAVAAGRTGDAAAVPEKPKGPPKPPDFSFSARMPRINQKDLEVLRVTAMFVARNGRQWMTQLAQREAGNPQFQFLIPNHTFHNFFQHLVDQYTTLIRAHGLGGEGGKLKDERVADLRRNVDDKYHVLGRARERAEYAKYEQAERLKREEDEVKKQEDFERIDWNDFVVVETITFTASDATANLPPPTTLSDLQYASLEERNKLSINANLRIEEAMPTDEEYAAAAPEGPPASFPLPVHTGYAPQQAPSPAQPQQYPTPTYPTAQVSTPTPPPGMGPAAPHRLTEEEEEERRIRERTEARTRAQGAGAGGAPLKIKENYVPRGAQRAKPAGPSALCPNCKQMIPLNEMEEHMRSKLPPPYPSIPRLPEHLLTSRSRTPRPPLEGAKGQGRLAAHADGPLAGGCGEQPQAAGEPANGRVRRGDGRAADGGGAGAAEESGGEQLRREPRGEERGAHQPAASDDDGGADQGYPRPVWRAGAGAGVRIGARTGARECRLFACSIKAGQRRLDVLWACG